MQYKYALALLIILAIIISGCLGNNSALVTNKPSAQTQPATNTPAVNDTQGGGTGMWCVYADLQSNIDFTEYDSMNHLLKTRVMNTGVTSIILGKYQVWTDGASVPTTWIISSPEKYTLPKSGVISIVLNVGEGEVNKIKLLSQNCAVSTTIYKPQNGWTSKSLSPADAISAERQ